MILELDIPLSPPSIWTNNHTPLHIQILPNPPQRARLRIKIIDRHIEKPLYLARVQIHRNDMITPCRLQHIGHEFRRDGGAGLVLLVLARVGEIGDHGRDAPGRGGLAGINHDEELH